MRNQSEPHLQRLMYINKMGCQLRLQAGFQKTGERTGFITKVIDSDNPYNIMLHEFGLKIDTYIDDLINNLT